MELNNLITLIEAVSDSNLTGFKYEEKEVKLHLTKTQKNTQKAVTADPTADSKCVPEKISQTAEATRKEPEGKIIKSPLVGTFYTAPSEDAAPFAAVGDQVKKGQPLAIIEAMKLMNEIESDYDGVITEILVENGQPVEYGQPLFRMN